MKAVCPYCRADFFTKSELTLHIAHSHPEVMRERGAEGYFQVLLSREQSGFYLRQINYYKRRR